MICKPGWRCQRRCCKSMPKVEAAGARSRRTLRRDQPCDHDLCDRAQIANNPTTVLERSTSSRWSSRAARRVGGRPAARHRVGGSAEWSRRCRDHSRRTCATAPAAALARMGRARAIWAHVGPRAVLHVCMRTLVLVDVRTPAQAAHISVTPQSMRERWAPVRSVCARPIGELGRLPREGKDLAGRRPS